MDAERADTNRRVAERVRHLNETQGWPRQQPGVVSVSLDEHGRVGRYSATDDGDVLLGYVTSSPT